MSETEYRILRQIKILLILVIVIMVIGIGILTFLLIPQYEVWNTYLDFLDWLISW